MIYGYATVSTAGQSVAAQIGQLKAAGAEKVYRETASGAKADRRELRRVLGQLAPGDSKCGQIAPGPFADTNQDTE